jgi:protease II
VLNIEWSYDNKSLYYTIPDELRRPCKVFKHLLGTPLSEDKLIFEVVLDVASLTRLRKAIMHSL